MVGVGSLLKKAKKMQDRIQSLQDELKQTTLDISSGGGAIKITINLQGEVQKLQLDPDFLKEDASFIEESLTAALQQATHEAKTKQEEETSKITAEFGLPGMPGF